MQSRHCENTAKGCTNFFTPPIRKRGRLMRFCSRRCRTQQWEAAFQKEHGETYSAFNVRRWRARKRQEHRDLVDRAKIFGIFL